MKTIEMALINTFVVKIILCLTLVNAELIAINNKISQADLPKSSDDPRLVKLQKEIAWQNKFSQETTSELKTFTNLMHQDVLSDIESEKNYISHELKDKLKSYGKELANTLKDKSSSSGTSISIVEKHMPAINNYFDVRIRSNAYFNLKKPEDLENKIQGTVNVQHSHRQDETPEINKSELLQVTDPNLANTLDKKIKDTLGSTMEQLRELNEKILQAEPSSTKTADEENKAEQLSLSLTNVLNKFENECQDYLTNEFRYLKDNLVARHETLNAQIDHVVRNRISKLELIKSKFSSEFTSKGQIRFFLYNTDANSKPVSFEEKKYTPWFNFDSNGNINVYDEKKTIYEFVEGLYQAKRISLDSFDPAYLYFESKGDFVFTPAQWDHFQFISFGYISLVPIRPSRNRYYKGDISTNEVKKDEKYRFDSTGYLGFVVNNVSKSSKIAQQLGYTENSTDAVWYSFDSYGQINIAS